MLLLSFSIQWLILPGINILVLGTSLTNGTVTNSGGGGGGSLWHTLVVAGLLVTRMALSFIDPLLSNLELLLCVKNTKG